MPIWFTVFASLLLFLFPPANALAQLQSEQSEKQDPPPLTEVWQDGELIYRWQGITVIGHRATMLFAPENTIAAINKALEFGTDVMELDVRQTKDGELVIVHDETVDRTTDGKGRISELTLAEIKSLDAGSKYSKDFKSEKIPTLREALRAMKGRALPDIDFKDGELAKLKTVLSEEGFLEGGGVSFLGTSSQFEEVRKWKTVQIRPTPTLGPLSLSSTVQALNPQIINVPEVHFSKSYINEIKKLGRKSWVNVILNRTWEESRLRRVVDGLPDYIQTDRADFLIPYLRKLGLHVRYQEL